MVLVELVVVEVDKQIRIGKTNKHKFELRKKYRDTEIHAFAHTDKS